MEVVGNADRYPGVCAVSGASEGPFVATGQFVHVPQGSEAFLAAQVVADAAAALGWLSPQAAIVAGEQGAELDRLRRELEQLREEHTILLDRIGYTLQNGAVVRGNKVKLRIPPWERGRRRGARRDAS